MNATATDRNMNLDLSTREREKKKSKHFIKINFFLSSYYDDLGEAAVVGCSVSFPSIVFRLTVDFGFC